MNPAEPETSYGSSDLFVFVSAEASRAVGTATTPSPVTATKKVKIFPPVVIGYTSPYSTEARVVIAHQRLWNTLLNASGWALCSKW